MMEVFWLFFSLFYLLGGRIKLGRWIVTVGVVFYLISNVTGSLEFSEWMHEQYFTGEAQVYEFSEY